MDIKKVSIAIVFSIATITAFAQDCSKFYSFDEGTTGQITSYEGNGKIAAIVDYTIKDVKSVGGTLTATMQSTAKDKKGEFLMESDYKLSCDGKIVTLDFNSLMDQKMFEQYKDFETEVTGENVLFPNNLSVGQNLPDSSVNVKISMSGIQVMEMNINIRNRKVVGRETITTSAGTFDCYVITYTNDFSMRFVNRSSNSKLWIVEGIGMVKQEDYNEKGKLTNSSLLTALNK